VRPRRHLYPLPLQGVGDCVRLAEGLDDGLGDARLDSLVLAVTDPHRELGRALLPFRHAASLSVRIYKPEPLTVSVRISMGLIIRTDIPHAMHPDELRYEMDADEYAEFLARSEARRELMGESMD